MIHGSALVLLLGMVLVLAVLFLPAGPIGAGEAVRVADQAGRAVEVRLPVKRIVTCFKPATLCVYALGLADRMVGAEGSHFAEPLLTALTRPGQLTQVGMGNRSVNLETIVSLKPDLTILFSQADGLEMADRLTGLGLPALVIRPESLEEIRGAMDLIARAVGEPRRGARTLMAMDRVLDLAGKAAGEGGGPRPRVYYASPQDLLSTAPGEMMQTRMIELAGGVSVSRELTGYFPRISPEQVTAWKPQVMVVSGRLAGDWRERLKTPAFRSLEAVRQGRVHVFPSNLAPWDYPSPLAALGVLWLARAIHPEAMEASVFRAEVELFHRELFGKGYEELGGAWPDGPGGEPDK